jgi:uncharacterized protein YndB with AHSA1/START domain
MSGTDRIEKTITLRAPLRRVWKAISNANEFGAWFGVEFDGPFTAGARMLGKVTPTKVDPEVAKMQEAYKGAKFEITIDRVEPERFFSFRWHPFAIDPKFDYSKEEATLVVFELSEVAGGTKLTIIETGFDRIPLERRAKAFAANDGGWAHQSKLVEKYLLLDAS